MRNSAIIYRTFWEAAKELPKEQQADLWNAICEKSFDFTEPEIGGIAGSFYRLIKPNLEANNKRFCNGKTPKQKQEGSKTEAKQKQEGSKTEAYKDKDKDKDKDIEEREKAFINALTPFLENYGKEMLNSFYRYWSEKNPKKTKMKFEIQKTWELSKRLANWSRKENDFKPINKQEISSMDDGAACCQ